MCRQFLMCGIILPLLLSGCGQKESERTVVVYTALDQIYSEPIFKKFEQYANIKVQPVYDTEAVKSVGLVNRLISEAKNPVCDVFWNNEIARTIVLKKMGLLQKIAVNKFEEFASNYIDRERYWIGFAARLRIIVYNTELVSEDEAPQSILDFVKPEWKGKLVIAYPLFGTTEVHFAALKLFMADQAEPFFRQLKQNEAATVDGNSVVVQLVSEGEYVAGFTDTDDAYSAMLQGKPVGMVFPDQRGMGCFLIPNTAAIIKDCRHPEEAQEFVQFLVSDEVQGMLAESPSAQIPIGKDVQWEKSFFEGKKIEVMDVDYEEVAGVMEETRELLQGIFVR